MLLESYRKSPEKIGGQIHMSTHHQDHRRKSSEGLTECIFLFSFQSLEKAVILTFTTEQARK